MVLSQADVDRLVAKGHKQADFSETDEDGFVKLRNVDATAPDEGKHCFFLRESRCSVYADRPEGCRWYPVILSDSGKVVRDEDCPHRQEFPVPPAAERKLLKIVAVLHREAMRR
jgi:Fe-S-cluster containining protein